MSSPCTTIVVWLSAFQRIQVGEVIGLPGGEGYSTGYTDTLILYFYLLKCHASVSTPDVKALRQ